MVTSTTHSWDSRAARVGALVADGAHWLSTAPWLPESAPASSAFPEQPVDELISLDEGDSLAALQIRLERFSAWPASSRFVLGFENLASARRVAGLIAGDTGAARGWADDEVRSLIEQLGLVVETRDAFARPQVSSFASATDRALQLLVRQLNPSAAADWLLYVLRPGDVTPTRPRLVEGLLSVVMRNHDTSRLQLFDHAIFSLAAQSHRPLEIIIATQSRSAGAKEALEAVLGKHQALGGYTFTVLHEPSEADRRARLVNLGLSMARGQYVAILDDDDVVYPNHYRRLIAALQGSDRAWAFAPIMRSVFERNADGDLYCVRKHQMPHSEHFDFAQLAYDNYVTCHSYVIDRLRLGRFDLHFEETLNKNEDYVMLLRLIAIFQPLSVGGPPSAEYRLRGDGSNTVLHELHGVELTRRLRLEWETAIAAKNALTDELQMLMSKATFVRETRKGLRADDPRSDEPFRYRLADLANTLLKRRLPRVHSSIKAAAEPRMRKEQ